LAEFHDVLPGAVSCRAVAVDDKILVSVGGCVLSCNTSGRVGWLRRQTYVPGPHEVSWSKERRSPRPGRPSFESPATPLAHDPPCMDQAQLYAAQPGGWEVECLDLDTGRLRWRQIVANLVRVRGVSGGALIVETNDELCALDRQTGKPLWSRTIRGPLVTLTAGPNSPTAILEQDLSAGSSDSRPTLAWLDPATGRTTASAALDLPAGNPSRLGPVVAAGGRVWVFFAADRTGAGRDLWELIPGDH
jgi:outer membrane protein assembly factor BamB